MWFGAELLELSDKDLGPTATSANQYILGAQPVLYDGYFPGENAWNIQFDYGLVVLPIPEGGLETGNGFPVDLTGDQRQLKFPNLPRMLIPPQAGKRSGA